MTTNQSNSKNYFSYYIIIFLYVIVSLIIVNFDLGEYQYSQYLINTIASIIPSIKPTAALTLTPHSVEFILSISWVLVVVIAFKLVLFVRWKNIDFESFYKNNSLWQVLGSIICVLALIIFMVGYTPENTGFITKFIYRNLKDSIYFVIFYGLGLWICLSACLFYVVFNLIYFFKK